MILLISLAILSAASALPHQKAFDKVDWFSGLEKDDIDFVFDGGSTGIKVFANPQKYSALTDSWATELDVKLTGVTPAMWNDPLLLQEQLWDFKERLVQRIVSQRDQEETANLPTADAQGIYHVNVVIAATAGMRGRTQQHDARAWETFMTFMTAESGALQCAFREFAGQYRPTHDSATVWGTQEALYEANTARKPGNEFVGFFSSGGASAQFGMNLCKPELEDMWGTIMAQEMGSHDVLRMQCHAGTQQDSHQIMSWSTVDKIDQLDGSNLGGAFDPAKCRQEGGCWALGSLFQCPDMGFIATSPGMVDDVDAGGVGGYQGTQLSMIKSQHKRGGDTITTAETVAFMKNDQYFQTIKAFTDLWREECLDGDARVAMAFASPRQMWNAINFANERTDDARAAEGGYYAFSDGRSTARVYRHEIEILQRKLGAGKASDIANWSNMYANGFLQALGFIQDGPAGPKIPSTGFNKLVGTRADSYDSQVGGTDHSMDWGASLGEYATGGDGRTQVWQTLALEKLEDDIHKLEIA